MFKFWFHEQHSSCCSLKSAVLFSGKDHICELRPAPYFENDKGCCPISSSCVRSSSNEGRICSTGELMPEITNCHIQIMLILYRIILIQVVEAFNRMMTEFSWIQSDSYPFDHQKGLWAPFTSLTIGLPMFWWFFHFLDSFLPSKWMLSWGFQNNHEVEIHSISQGKDSCVC